MTFRDFEMVAETYSDDSKGWEPSMMVVPRSLKEDQGTGKKRVSKEQSFPLILRVI